MDDTGSKIANTTGLNTRADSRGQFSANKLNVASVICTKSHKQFIVDFQKALVMRNIINEYICKKKVKSRILIIHDHL